MRSNFIRILAFCALTVGGVSGAVASEFTVSRNSSGEGAWLRRGKLVCSTDEGRASAVFDSTTRELLFKCGNSVERKFELGENERQLVYNESVEGGGTAVTVVIMAKSANR